MIWPAVRHIKRLKAAYPTLHIILQVGGVALDRVDNSPMRALDRINEYGDSIDAVLLDKSMGRGLGMDAAFLRPFITEINTARPNLGITVAGGLGPKTLSLVENLIKDFRFLSIDAQGQLRPSGNALDPIDMIMTTDYVREAVTLFKKLH